MKKVIIPTFILFVVSVLAIGQNNIPSKQFPSLVFRKNSLTFDTIQDYDKNTYGLKDTSEIIEIILDILRTNPQYKIIIYGTSDLQEPQRKLGLRRADKVKKTLIKRGINAARIEIQKGRPLFSEKDVLGIKNNQEKELLRRFNRLVSFSFGGKYEVE